MTEDLPSFIDYYLDLQRRVRHRWKKQKREMMPKKLVKVACCMPKQEYTIADKLKWLEKALDKTECDLFLTPQEYLGGHYVMPKELHVDREWLYETAGKLARKRKVCLGVGACAKTETAGAMEDYVYFDSKGEPLGRHSKFALPSYDDARTGGHGQLWPETSYNRRVTPVDIPELRLRVGTVFCWEVFSQAIWPSYSFQRVNLVAHPIKFAPRGWLKNKVQGDGKKHIVGFGNAPKSRAWVDRLLMAGRHQVMCPIAVSCNSWNLGDKFMALVGHVDEMKRTTDLLDVPSAGEEERIHTFEMLPEWYEGLDHHHSAGAFVAHVGSVEGYSELGEWTMHAKMRRLEAHLIGGTVLMDCHLKAAALSRQKSSTLKRALKLKPQKIEREKRV